MFEPKNEKAFWRMIFDYVEKMDTGVIINYKTLSEVIGADIEINRASVYRAAKEMLKTQKRFLQNKRGQGYQIVEGMDIMYHAEGRQGIAKRQIKLADYETRNINTIKLTADEKSKLQNFMAFNSNIKAAFTQTFDRIEQMQQISSQFTESEVNRLRDMIK